RISGDGLITLERARLLTRAPAALDGAAKLTVYVGRHERAGGQPAVEAVVALLQRRGVAGATAPPGSARTGEGVRRRAHFAGRNAGVPAMVVSVGDGDRIGAVLPELRALLGRPLATLERVTVCKRDGERLAEPPTLADVDGDGLGLWQKLTVF